MMVVDSVRRWVVTSQGGIREDCREEAVIIAQAELIILQPGRRLAAMAISCKLTHPLSKRYPSNIIQIYRY